MCCNIFPTFIEPANRTYFVIIINFVSRLSSDPTENKAENSSSVELGDLSPQSASSSQFIPYRDSVLTRVLQPSLDGNFVNVVYLCISNDSNASVSHGLRMAMELRGLPQTVER